MDQHKVVRDTLRLLEEREIKLEALHAHLAEGAAQAARGEFVENYSLSRLIAGADAGGWKSSFRITTLAFDNLKKSHATPIGSGVRSGGTVTRAQNGRFG
jgi:hypothetical protein